MKRKASGAPDGEQPSKASKESKTSKPSKTSKKKTEQKAGVRGGPAPGLAPLASASHAELLAEVQAHATKVELAALLESVGQGTPDAYRIELLQRVGAFFTGKPELTENLRRTVAAIHDRREKTSAGKKADNAKRKNERDAELNQWRFILETTGHQVGLRISTTTMSHMGALFTAHHAPEPSYRVVAFSIERPGYKTRCSAVQPTEIKYHNFRQQDMVRNNGQNTWAVCPIQWTMTIGPKQSFPVEIYVPPSNRLSNEVRVTVRMHEHVTGKADLLASTVLTSCVILERVLVDGRLLPAPVARLISSFVRGEPWGVPRGVALLTPAPSTV